MKPLHLTFSLFFVATLAFAGWLWFILLSPYGYTPPPNLTPIEQHTKHRVFVYGTLTYPWVRRVVIGHWVETKPAVLKNYQQEALDLKPALGQQVIGQVFVVTPAQLERLDRYERLGIRYQRVKKTLASGQQAWVYERLSTE